MKFLPAFSSLIISSFFVLPVVAKSKDDTQQSTGRPQTGWSSAVRGGAVYQFDTDLDKGGSYSSGRYNVKVGKSYAWTRRDTATLALS